MWFYQENDEPESVAQQEQPKPGPSRAAATSNTSKTPQGNNQNTQTMHYPQSKKKKSENRKKNTHAIYTNHNILPDERKRTQCYKNINNLQIKHLILVTPVDKSTHRCDVIVMCLHVYMFMLRLKQRLESYQSTNAL